VCYNLFVLMHMYSLLNSAAMTVLEAFMFNSIQFSLLNSAAMTVLEVFMFNSITILMSYEYFLSRNRKSIYGRMYRHGLNLYFV
jgi:hypothetical protein